MTDKKIASPCLIMCLRGDEDALSINKYPTLSSSSCGPTHDDCESPNMEVKNELTSSCYFIYSDQKSITNKSLGSDGNSNEELPCRAVVAPGTRPHLQTFAHLQSWKEVSRFAGGQLAVHLFQSLLFLRY